MAEALNTRTRTSTRQQARDFQVGYHVRVEAKYFDDQSQPEENRYSTSIDGTHVKGVITFVSSLTYKVLFDDGNECYMPKSNVELIPRSTSCVRVVGEENTSSVSDDDNEDDSDWAPSEEDTDKVPGISDPNEERYHYLIHGKKKLFVGKLISTEPGAIVHHKVLQECERKFEIIQVIDAHHWPEYDEDRHCVGSFIAWDLGATELKVVSRNPVDGLEMVIPAVTLQQYNKHLAEGCEEACASECMFKDDKVYHEWVLLKNTSPEKNTPEKTLKRMKFNQKEARKKLKLEGKPYVTAKGKEKPGKKPVQWVDCKCRNKCGENLNMEERTNIYKKYWDIATHNERKQYIVGRMQSVVPKQSTTKEASRRGQTLLYHLDKDSNTRIQVCSKVFLATLHVTQKFVRYTWEHSDQGFAKHDGRGFSTIPKHKLTDEQKDGVKKHLDSFVKVPAHYVRKDSTKLYIEDTSNFSKLTVALMHKLYLQECAKENSGVKPVGYDSYRHIFESLNYEIHKPKKDQCKVCTKYERSTAEEKAAGKKSFDQHIQNNKNVMALKEEFKNKGKENEDFLVFNFDLEAVLYTPCDKVSTIFYKRKLCTYNCTTFNLVTKSGDCFMWNETEGNRGSNEIATSLYLYLQKTKATEVVMFSDTCGGQNRNQFIASMLLYIIQNHQTIKKLDFIFMVQGHSHMEVDNMHSAIERKSGGLQIHTPYGWEIVAAIARRNPYYVHSLKYDDFVDTKQLKKDLKITNVNVNDKKEKVRWNNENSIAWMRFEKEHSNTIFYKLSYDKNEEFQKIPVNRRKVLRSSDVVATQRYSLPKAYDSRLPLSSAKLKDLQDLCNDLTIPTSHHGFYEEVARLDARDDSGGESDVTDRSDASDNDEEDA